MRGEDPAPIVYADQKLQDIFAQVFPVIKKYKKKDTVVMPPAELVGYLGLESLDMVEFVMDLEDLYDIAVSDADVDKVTTVDGLVRYIAGVLEAKEKARKG